MKLALSMLVLVYAFATLAIASEQEGIHISAGEKAAGVITHQITSPYQAATTELRSPLAG